MASVDYKSDEIDIYPNPVIDKLVISAAYATELRIYNQIGLLVKEVKLRAGDNEVNLADLRSGMYYLKTESGQFERILNH